MTVFVPNSHTHLTLHFARQKLFRSVNWSASRPRTCPCLAHRSYLDEEEGRVRTAHATRTPAPLHRSLKRQALPLHLDPGPRFISPNSCTPTQPSRRIFHPLKREQGRSGEARASCPKSADPRSGREQASCQLQDQRQAADPPRGPASLSPRWTSEAGLAVP